MTWKKLNNAHFGTSTTFGGADIDKISKLLDGTLDIDEQDIDSSTTVRSNKLRFRNPAETYSYTINPSAITADRTITLPALANDSEFLFENAMQTVSNKTLSNCAIPSPTFINQGVGEAIQDPSIKRWGTYMPRCAGTGTTPSTVSTFSGMLKAHTSFGLVGQGYLAGPLAGLWTQHYTNTTEGDNAGIRPPTSGIGPMRTARAGKIRARVMPFGSYPNTGYMTMHCGLADYTSIPTYTGAYSALGNTDEGIYIVGAGITNPWSIQRSDGIQFAVNSISGSNLDMQPHMIELSWPAGGTPVTASIDNTYTYSATTRLPSPTTDLRFWLLLETTGNQSAGVFVFSIWIEST